MLRLTENERLRRFFDVVFVLTTRSIRERYRGSFLGIGWSMLNPILMTAVYTVVFGAQFAPFFNNSTLAYSLSVFVGLVVMNYFGQSTAQSVGSVVANRGLLNKIRLPLLALPFSIVSAHVFQLLLGAFPLLLVVTLWQTHSIVHALLVPIPLIALVLFSGGIGLLVSAFFVFYRDLAYMYDLVVFLFWVVSPVFYPFQIVSGTAARVLELNPLFPMLQSLRAIVLGPALPPATQLGMALLNGVIVAAIGYITFRELSNEFMDVL